MCLLHQNSELEASQIFRKCVASYPVLGLEASYLYLVHEVETPNLARRDEVPYLHMINGAYFLTGIEVIYVAASLPLAFGYDELSGAIPVGRVFEIFGTVLGTAGCRDFKLRDSEIPTVDLDTTELCLSGAEVWVKGA